MGTDPLTGKPRGLSRRSGLGDLVRPPAVRCTRTADLECHHVIRDAGNTIANAQMLCKACHAATESYGVSGLIPPPFDEAVKEAVRLRCRSQCECTRAHPDHGYEIKPSISSLSGYGQR